MKNIIPKCRHCAAESTKQSIKGEHVYGGHPTQHFYECSECKIIYLYPPMSQEDEIKFYSQEFEKYMSNRAGDDMDWTGPENHIASNQREVNRRLPFLDPMIKDCMNVLEVGCSSGFMLYPLQEKGCKVFGIDPSGGFLDFVRSKGIICYQSIEEIKELGLEFDLIIHYYVLEHIREPLVFIHNYMALLRSNAHMVFEVPCGSDPLIELYKNEAFDKFYWSVAHHWYFNRESLSHLLNKTGYSYSLYPDQRYDLSNHLVWCNEGKPGGYGKYSELFGEKLDLIYRNVLKDNWLCDTIIAKIGK